MQQRFLSLRQQRFQVVDVTLQTLAKTFAFHIGADLLAPLPEQIFAMQSRRDAESLHAFALFQVGNVTW